MKNILTIGASNSRNSINKQLAKYVASQIIGAEINLVDLNDFEMPIFSVDRENDNGIPDLAREFNRLVTESDAIIISFAEHNGSYSAAFKNILDWCSRLEGKLWDKKPMFLMATSPGGRGGATVLNLAKNYFPFMGAKVEASFSLPSFYDKFSTEDGIKDTEVKAMFKQELNKFITAI